MRYPTNAALAALAFFLTMTLAGSAWSEERKPFWIELEAGPVWQSKNDVRKPGNTGTEFSFKDLTGEGPYAAGRLTFVWDFKERHGLRFIYAPLRVDGTGTFNAPVSFAGGNFAAGVSTEGSYKFDTYRLGYRWLFYDKNAWQLREGGTLLIRDAEIKLEQAGVSASDSNVGGAPLLNFTADWAFANQWTATVDFEGLAGGPGRALDLALKLSYDLTDNWSIGGGYRALEGGVDTDETYNFSWFNYLFASVAYRF